MKTGLVDERYRALAAPKIAGYVRCWRARRRVDLIALDSAFCDFVRLSVE